MQTKRTTGIKVAYDNAAQTMTWVDIEGRSPAIVLNVDQLPEAIRTTGMWHGLDQKVTDAGAMGVDHWDGAEKPKRSATTAERMARMRRVADNLTAGNWNVRASADPLANLSADALATLIAAATAKLTALGVSVAGTDTEVDG